MTTLSSISAKNPQLFIAVNRNRVKTSYKNGESVAFLPNGTEFQLELFNKTDVDQKAEIFINGKLQNYGLVLRPGERYYLDRFMDEDRKLKFDTYEVEDTPESREAIANNGFIEVRFYAAFHSVSPQIPYHYSTPYYTYPWYTTPDYTTSNTSYNPQVSYRSYSSKGSSLGVTTSAGTTHFGSPVSCNAFSVNAGIDYEPNVGKCAINNTTLETGRVEKGGQSNQSFQNYYGSFQSLPNTIIKYHIMPDSQKSQEMHTDEIRSYCSNCGRRVKNGWQFCAGCGQKV